MSDAVLTRPSRPEVHRVKSNGRARLKQHLQWQLPCIGVNITAFGRKLTLFSTIPLSRFSLKMSRFFAYFELERMRSMRSFSFKWNSDDSATSFQCSTKLVTMICVTKSRTGNYDFRACARARGFPGSTMFGRTRTLRRVCRAITR